MLMTSGVNFGIKQSVPHLLGISLGFPAMILAVGLGMSTVFQAYPILHTVIKVLGICYLLYLSWLIANSSSKMEGKKSVNLLASFKRLHFNGLIQRAGLWLWAL